MVVVPVSEAAHRQPVREPGRGAPRRPTTTPRGRSASPRIVGCTRSVAPVPTSRPTRGRASRTTATPRSTSRSTRRAGGHRHHRRRLRPRRALQLLPGDAQAHRSRPRAAAPGVDLGDRRAVLLRRPREQLPHPRAGRRWSSASAPAVAPASCTASACSTPSTTSWSLTVRDRRRYPRPVHDVGARRPPVDRPVDVVDDYAGPATIAHLHGDVRPRRVRRTRCR